MLKGGSSKNLTVIMRNCTTNENEIEWQRPELQTSCFSGCMTAWKNEGTDLRPEVVKEFIR
jgi:hypothetical protein